MASVADQLKKIADRSERDMNTVVRRTNLQLSTSIVLKTPVDKGFLRGGWVAQINSEPASSPERVDKSGQLALNGARAIVGQSDLGDEYYFVNALPYAAVVENGEFPQPGTDKTVNGYSRQAPQGMVKISIREIKGIIEREAARV